MANKAAKKPAKKSVSKAKPKARMASGDIIKLILADHVPLKRLIKVLKSDKPLGERQTAFKEFVPLLTSHAKPEEETLYVAMKDREKLRAEGFEGDVEHSLADQMCEEASRATDTDVWSAKVKVLAELVEHHIKEEEEDMLPDFKKVSDADERIALGEKYTRMHDEMLAKGGGATKHESKLNKAQPDMQVQH